jgi:hypothetical protein
MYAEDDPIYMHNSRDDTVIEVAKESEKENSFFLFINASRRVSTEIAKRYFVGSLACYL